MFWLKYLKSLIQAISANTSANQLAAGVALGAVLGLLPAGNLLAVGLWGVLLLFQIHIGIAGLAAVVFAILGSLTDPLVERVGLFLLTGVPAFHGLWTALYNTPLIPFTAFNNTLVLGNFVVGLALSPLLFLGSRWAVETYRARWLPKLAGTRFMKSLKTIPLADWILRWLEA